VSIGVRSAVAFTDVQAGAFAAMAVTLLVAAIVDRRTIRLIAALMAAAPAVYLAIQFSYAGAPPKSYVFGLAECAVGLYGAVVLAATRARRELVSRTWMAQTALSVAIIPLVALVAVRLLTGLSKPLDVWAAIAIGPEWLLVLVTCAGCLSAGRGLLAGSRDTRSD
jgi:hypothetical protein